MDPLAELIGRSPGIVAVRQTLGRLLQRHSDARRLPALLIQGETGTGKGLLARAIHRVGPRRNGPFVDVNCAAIPETLLEAEFFGFERGAFTDARQAKPGLFQVAHRGTIFLDEVGLLPEALQGKLLTVIEERAVRRLGSTRSEPVDVWILSATSANLLEAIRARRFHDALYHRLAVLTLWLPPLRERGDDILLLAEHALARACADYGLAPKTLALDARAALVAYPWPGNVRELANVMERVALLAEEPVVTRARLGLAEPPAVAERESPPPREAVSLDQEVETVERAHLLEALRQTDWNISRAAARLRIPRNTLRYRIEKLGLRRSGSPPAPRRRAERAAPRAAQVPAPVSVESAPVGLRWDRRRLTLLRAVATMPADAKTRADLSRAVEVMLDKVQSFGGRVEELSLAGITAAFGLEPVEDAPRRTALAAIAISKAAQRFGELGSAGVQVKIGIHTESFMVGRAAGTTVIDQDAKREGLRVLDEVAESAEPGAIAVSDAARTLLERRFDLVPTEAVTRSAGRVLRLAGRERTGLELLGAMTPFVGRRHDLELLMSRWASATTGRGQAVGIVGEAGLGKSRLLFEFRQRLAGQRVTYLEGQCLSYASSIPYHPVLEIVRSSCGIHDADQHEAVVQKVRRTLDELGMDAADATPYLVYLLGFKEGTDRLMVLSPEAVKVRTFEILRQLVLRRSRREPVIVVVEDLHWIDNMSEEYLSSLVEAVGGTSVLVVTTSRPGYRPPWLERSYVTQIALQALSPEDSLAVVRAVLPTEQIADALVETVLGKAEGNPFFLEELSRAVREHGGLAGTLAVPDTIEQVIRARIDRLPPDDKQLLQCAAAIGKDVPFPLVRAIAELPEETLRRGFLNLKAGEFLYEASLSPELEYTFKHTLIQEVAYDSVVPRDLRILHGRIVEAIERLYPDHLPQRIERLGHHAFQAEAWEKAVTYLRQAGQKAFSRSAHRDAARCFEQALTALQRLPQDQESIQQAVDLCFDLRVSLLPLGQHGRILDYLREAETLAGDIGDEPRLARAYSYLTHYFWLTGDQERAVESGERALALAASTHDFSVRVVTNFYLGLAYHSLGDYGRAADVLRQTVDALDDTLRLERFGMTGVLSVHALSWLVWGLAERGEFTEGIARGEEAVRIAETADQPFSLIQACLGIGGVYLRKGDLEQAIAVLERGRALSQAADIPILLPRVIASLGYAHALAGRLGEGVPLLEAAVAQSASMRLMFHSLFLLWLAEAYALAGRLEKGMELAMRALGQSREHRERGLEAWGLRLVGEIQTHTEPLEAAKAEDHYRRSMELAEQLGMRPLFGHSHLGLAVLYRKIGVAEQARSHLSAAAELFRSMGMTFWMSRAEAVRATIG